jgi:hypothetical protein
MTGFDGINQRSGQGRGVTFPPDVNLEPPREMKNGGVEVSLRVNRKALFYPIELMPPDCQQIGLVVHIEKIIGELDHGCGAYTVAAEHGRFRRFNSFEDEWPIDIDGGIREDDAIETGHIMSMINGELIVDIDSQTRLAKRLEMAGERRTETIVLTSGIAVADEQHRSFGSRFICG